MWWWCSSLLAERAGVMVFFVAGRKGSGGGVLDHQLQIQFQMRAMVVLVAMPQKQHVVMVFFVACRRGRGGGVLRLWQKGRWCSRPPTTNPTSNASYDGPGCYNGDFGDCERNGGEKW
ncbi:hypothetical protein L1987_16151 [Smallanthus sonchifolius]|uniref:Uncharacterized protein n=1 Tax=Smallanthus sonchifolius TaxID=185202 RepID=A0ACB9J9T1_9ASTR|nr:hypothetical protein L1987_16151 [Smallanthus sonchifolius]